MKANLCEIVLFYGVWMLIPMAQGQNARTVLSGFSSQRADEDNGCLCAHASNSMMMNIDRLQAQMETLEATLTRNENCNGFHNIDFLNDFFSRLKDQLDRETELKAEIAVLKFQLTGEISEKVKVKKTINVLELEATQLKADNLKCKENLQHEIESIENSKKLLEVETIKLSECKNNLDQKIETYDGSKSGLHASKANPSDLVVEEKLPSSCSRTEQPSGTYQIKLPESSPFSVRCENEIAGPRWIVIQKRFNGSVDFYQNWYNYVKGFGSLDGEFFLGLQAIHLLTNYEPHEFYAHLEHFDGKIEFEHCKSFRVGSEKEEFVLTVGECTGVYEFDSIFYHNGNKFSTVDRDNDLWKEGECAVYCHGGWWYNDCAYVNPNGNYYAHENKNAIYWTGHVSLKSVQLLIRPINLKTIN